MSSKEISSTIQLLANGVQHHEAGRLDEAEECYLEALAIQPNVAQGHFNLAHLMMAQGKLDKALAAFRQAIRFHPDSARAHSGIGSVLMIQGEVIEAEAAYRQAIRLNPKYPEAYSNLGNALAAQGMIEDAVEAYRHAIRLKPDYAEAYCNLGNALVEKAELSEAAAAYRQAVKFKPQYHVAFSNMLLCLNYDEYTTPQSLYTLHQEWDARYGRQEAVCIKRTNGRDPSRRLKIGYVSPDFRQHSVAYFLEPLLAAHDRQQVEVFCYSDVKQPDCVTSRLQGLADHWTVATGLSDEILAERVRTDCIDILVDLAGHSANNRLLVFARRPALVQVTWLGYPNTTGLKTMDYRIVDSVTDPSEEGNGLNSEVLVRLENGFVCYGMSEGPMPGLRSSAQSDGVTFGSFNNPAKISMATISAWAKLLLRLPQSRLLLKGRSFADGAARAVFLARLSDCGVRNERVELLSWDSDTFHHLKHYQNVDIALDPFPYNGTTTTCEALWMGVPVITLRGHCHAGRVGASLLTQIGLRDLIASSVEEYVETACALAGNFRRLDELRQELRPKLLSSPLCDQTAFARKMETAFRTMWQHWCAQGGARDI